MTTVATYHIPGYGPVGVVAQPELGTGDTFYDLFDADGSCLNEGALFWELPSEQTVREFLADVVQMYWSRCMYRVAYTDMEDPGDDVHYTSPTSILDAAVRRRDREIANGNSAWVKTTETRWVRADM